MVGRPSIVQRTSVNDMHSLMRIPIFIAGLLLLTLTAGRAEQFLTGFEDVPLMPGIEPVVGSDVMFDSPVGRIVEAYATGTVTSKALRSYYRAALPQLGWTLTGPLKFSREGERLTIDLYGQSPLTVRFALRPAMD